MDFFGMDENSKKLMLNGCKNDEVKDATDSQEFDIQECRSWRMLAGNKVEFHCSGQSCDTVHRQGNLPAHGFL